MGEAARPIPTNRQPNLRDDFCQNDASTQCEDAFMEFSLAGYVNGEKGRRVEALDPGGLMVAMNLNSGSLHVRLKTSQAYY
ncbi:MAG TPA: hypothetical protein PKA21_13515 [Kiritimatiellia bacterium]|nr:hypothetical protein [Kiritimatiellia bacterium]